MTVTPTQGAASTVITGGVAVVAVAAVVTGINGGYVVNPLAASDQNVGTAENLYVNEVTAATLNGFGTTVALLPGQRYNLTPGSVNAVSVNAASAGHRFTVVWY